MAALVQTYPQQTNTVTVLPARPTTTAMLPAQSHAHQPYVAGQQGQRNFSGTVTGSPVYRGSVGPIQPYAFTSTPNLNTTSPYQHHGSYRTTSSPAVPPPQGMGYAQDPRTRHAAHASLGNLSYNPSPMGVSQSGSRDDSSIPQARVAQGPRPQSAYFPGAPMQMTFAQAAAMKPTPDRYRRPSQQTRQHSGAVQNRPNSYYNNVDNTHSQSDEATQQNRVPTPKSSKDKDSKSLRLVPSDHNMHIRSNSSESVASSRSSHSRPSSSTNRNVSNPTGAPSLNSSVSDEGQFKQDPAKAVNVPPRSSSSDAAKRTLSRSPLSKLASMEGDSATQNGSASSSQASQQRPASSAGGNLNSPAAQRLAAINQKGKSQSKTSKLRRAFSFGSAAEFKAAEKTAEKPAEKPSGNNIDNADKNEPARLHKEPSEQEMYDAEQEAIARKQEASGLGNSIYGGRFFAGSTDNISVSSTASSASIMIRKMGRGMKKSGRSLAGLFRPKSVIGVPPADSPLGPEATEASVSMVTVEAERVNVNPDPRDQNGGGTGFPHLERNSLDVSNTPSMVSERAGSSGTDNSASRRSIVGGDRERAEVLAAVRKGILKHPGSSSPSPAQEKSPGFSLPNIPHVSDSPISSAPSTPVDEVHSHRRAGSVAIGSEDYFVSAMKLRQDTKSAPSTPQGAAKRNATFSPRIVFHDTWPSQEYDRRGDIATCNRLTPMLAQQIKEELNTFKMEMEVHENSKIYTHFF